MGTEGALFGDPGPWSVLSAALEPVEPPVEVRARLLASLDGSGRLSRFRGELAACFDLPEARITELLERIEDPSAWTQGIAPILGFLHVRPGPRHAGLHGGFVRMQGGTRVPPHRHRDRELTLVLEGTLVDGDERRYPPGELVDMPVGSVHTLLIAPEGPALLAVISGAIEMLGS